MSMIPNLMLNIFMDLPQLFQERVGIPIQQVARVVDSGKALTPGESAYISRIMWPGKMISEYDPSRQTESNGTAILTRNISMPIRKNL